MMLDLFVAVRRLWRSRTSSLLLIATLTALLAPLEKPLVIGPQRPFVIMLAGVNGAGKTTSIGKIAR